MSDDDSKILRLEKEVATLRRTVRELNSRIDDLQQAIDAAPSGPRVLASMDDLIQRSVAQRRRTPS